MSLATSEERILFQSKGKALLLHSMFNVLNKKMLVQALQVWLLYTPPTLNINQVF